MPLYKSIQTNNSIQVMVWKISESKDELLKDIILTENSIKRVSSMKSIPHQKGFLSIRRLFRELGYSDNNVCYDTNGKPNLNDNKNISITHSFEYSAVIVSDKNTGIDLEQQREKIIRIADKFTDFQNDFFDKENTNQTVRQLTAIWGIKESIYKFHSQKGLSLKDHINVFPFDIESGKITAEVNFNNTKTFHSAEFIEFDGYTLVYLV